MNSRLTIDCYHRCLVCLGSLLRSCEPEADQNVPPLFYSEVRREYERFFIWGKHRGDGSLPIDSLIFQLPQIMQDQLAGLLLDLSLAILYFGSGLN